MMFDSAAFVIIMPVLPAAYNGMLCRQEKVFIISEKMSHQLSPWSIPFVIRIAISNNIT
jgi:hypothetical protein